MVAHDQITIGSNGRKRGLSRSDVRNRGWIGTACLHGPTGRMEFVGPVGKGMLEPYAYDKAVMEKLWDRSEEETGFSWGL